MPFRIKTDAQNEIKLMFAAHREAMWNRWKSHHPQALDPTVWQFVYDEQYYGESFGIVRGLALSGYGYLGSDISNAVQEGKSNVPEHNLKWWFTQVITEYLEEEGYFKKHCNAEVCAGLLNKYRKLRTP